MKSNRNRPVVAIVGLVLICLGAGSLFHGHYEYTNWWGGYVFAPFAIVIGIWAIVIAIFLPKALRENTERRRRRIRGWPTGHARYYRRRN